MPSRMSPPSDHVDLWLAHLPRAGEAPPAFERWLSVEERRRVDALIRPPSRLQRLVAYAARRAVLSFYSQCDPGAWRFVAGVHGRPEFTPVPGAPPLRVSLSHTEGLVAIAVAQTADVGVDVERVDPRRRVLEIAEYCFALEETAALLAASAEARPALFATLWTLKESYLKARGVGLWGGVGLSACRFKLADNGRKVLFYPAPAAEDRPDEWRFITFKPTPGHRGAVAVKRAGVVSTRLAAFALSHTLDSFTVDESAII